MSESEQNQAKRFCALFNFRLIEAEEQQNSIKVIQFRQKRINHLLKD
jgi:hypothetical protein